jgi:cytochrome c2
MQVTSKQLIFTLGISFIIFILFFIKVISFGAFADSAQYSGVVVDSKGFSINKATVRLQGTSFSALSDPTGFFKISLDVAVASRHITAWKEGYYNGGVSLSAIGTKYSIVLKSIQKEDNSRYAWLPSLNNSLLPGKTALKPCQQCHAELAKQWSESTHGSSAINPLFLAFFNGTDIYGRNGFGPGYKLDFPNSSGNCVTCHVPAMALDKPFNSDPREARGIEREGVFCDFCHKIDEVHIDKVGGMPGTLSLKFNRPAVGHQIFYGQHDDVFPGDDSYHPLYKESRYCAPCHNGRFWNVLMYSEFEEWAESSYAMNNVHCQDCHMASDGIKTRFAPEEKGGIERGPKTISSHVFNGVGDRALMMEAIDLDIQVELKERDLIVIARVKNIKAGHHYPTGNPMRNMILLVEASKTNGYALPFISGERVPVWGGIGAVEEGNYAGLPGKGFAKVLRDSISYPDGRGLKHFQPEYPAPHWRPAYIESDNRIPANSTDVSQYAFHVPEELRGSIHVNARLIFRKSYKNWIDIKAFAINDLELAHKSQTIAR